MLESMKRIQLEQMDIRQACVGWANNLRCVQVHMDLEATQYVHSLKDQENIKPDKPPDREIQEAKVNKNDDTTVRQQDCNDSELPTPLPNIQ